MFDVFYIGDNKQLQDHLPFAKQVESTNGISPKTKMYWLVEPNIEVNDYDVFNFRPADHDQVYEHVWKWNTTNYGGLKLLPKSGSKGIKQVNKIVCKKAFDILNTTTPETYFDENPYATHVWCVDPEYKLAHDINWAPDSFEPDFIHSFHLRGQLEHKYPAEEGGVKLFPRNWRDSKIKYHTFLDANIKYPVIYVSDTEDHTQRDIYKDDYVWLIDKEYRIEHSSVDWVPSPFEEQYIHVFKIPTQLQEKYPMAMGGIRLVPKDWRSAGLKIHPDCPIEDENYDVFYVDDDEFNADKYTELATRSKTSWFWVVDREYEFNAKLLFVPASHEQDYIHVFKIPEMLEERYPVEVTEPWDGRCGGVRLVNKNFDMTKHKYQENIIPLRYDIFYTDNPKEQFATFARKSKTKMFWLIDSGYIFDNNFKIVVPKHEQKYILNFQINQMQHKYPEQEGGIYLIPKSVTTDTQVKYKGMLNKVVLEFEKYTSETEGREKSKTEWFWVVDPDVEVLDDFDFGFIPDIWDKGKTHIWQKLNPKTGRQYDYSGVMLCHKEPLEKGRPKYMRTAACKQREYPVYYLHSDDYKKPLYDAYVRYSMSTQTKMFWIVDAYTQLDPDFKFDYYPTQWDTHCIHVFLNEDGEHKNVRLIPKNLFEEWEYSDEEIANNSFNDLKLINTVASLKPSWPIIHLTDFNRDNFVSELESYRDGYETGKQESFVWTVDPFVNSNIKISPIKEGFIPKVTDVNKVHCWQKLNDITGQVHGYGGLRLWPTAIDYSALTSDALKLNKIRNVQYVKKEGSISNTFDVVFLSYKEPNAETSYEKLKDKISQISTISSTPINLIWIKDVEGIFNAHKQAAQQVSSKMFWVVDADAEITDSFDFSYMPDSYDEEVVHVWNSKNPVNGLVYGYGGVKLLPTEIVRKATSWGLDFTTGLSNRFKSIAEVACTTRFNTDAYSTWRSAFRECVKLTLKDDAESKQRLDGWMHPVLDADFRDEAKRGAEEGRAFALMYKDDISELNNINNFEWLYDHYTRNN